jgi:polyhydroxybutyrate depolymerase
MILNKKLTSCFSLALILSIATAGASFARSSRGRHSDVLVDGLRRSYRIYVPKTLRENASLIIVLHGIFSPPAYVAWDTQISKQSRKNNFIAVYPRGVGLSWNAGDCCGKAAEKQINDVAFIKELLKQLLAKYSIDEHKVYAAGFSNGGMLCYRLAQDTPATFAGIAVVEGSLRSFKRPDSGSINMMIIHGGKDRVFPLQGGTGHWLNYETETPAAENVAKFWADYDKCNPEPVTIQNDKFEKRIYSGGTDGARVCLLKIFSNAHCWPGGRESKIFHRFGGAKISATREIFDFFLDQETAH